MKKLVAFIMMVVCSICFLGCGKNSVDNESINKAITHIQANELENALIVCQTMDTKTIEEGSNKILECVLEQLNYYLSPDNWTNTKYVLVDSNAIDCLKLYKEILSLVTLEDSFTNANTFVLLALQLEDYVKWNEYYKADDNYLTAAQNYMNQGAP